MDLIISPILEEVTLENNNNNNNNNNVRMRSGSLAQCMIGSKANKPNKMNL